MDFILFQFYYHDPKTKKRTNQTSLKDNFNLQQNLNYTQWKIMAMMANLFAQNVLKIPAIDACRKQESP